VINLFIILGGTEVSIQPNTGQFGDPDLGGTVRLEVEETALDALIAPTS